MELIQHTFSYTQFQNTNIDLTGNSVSYIFNLQTVSGFTSYDSTSFDYNDITNALYDKFPPNQFFTSPGGSLSAYTIVNFVEPHTINIGEYILLKPLFGDNNLLGLNMVDDVGDGLGGNPDYNVWIHKGYSGITNGLAIVQINEILSFFKGFNIQPTYDSINAYFLLIECYLKGPDVTSFINIGVGDYIKTTPRRLFNELGFILTDYTGGTNNLTINLPVYLTQTMQNIGLYELPYSSITDNQSINVLPMPDSYYIEYSLSNNPYITSGPVNNFSYILTDGITANTYSDFYELSATTITGITSEKSIKVRKYATNGIRRGYQLPSPANTFSFTLYRNTHPNINDGYIEYTTVSPLSAATTSSFSYNSWGRSPQNNSVGNTDRLFVSMVHDELHNKMVLEPKITNDVFLDRGVFSPFERVYKLGYLRSLDDIVSFERGEFNVVSGIPLERSYLTNG